MRSWRSLFLWRGQWSIHSFDRKSTKFDLVTTSCEPRLWVMLICQPANKHSFPARSPSAAQLSTRLYLDVYANHLIDYHQARQFAWIRSKKLDRSLWIITSRYFFVLKAREISRATGWAYLGKKLTSAREGFLGSSFDGLFLLASLRRRGSRQRRLTQVSFSLNFSGYTRKYMYILSLWIISKEEFSWYRYIVINVPIIWSGLIVRSKCLRKQLRDRSVCRIHNRTFYHSKDTFLNEYGSVTLNLVWTRLLFPLPRSHHVEEAPAEGVCK